MTKLGMFVESRFGDWYRALCGHRKLGLRYEDLLCDYQPAVKEAIRRLPTKERQARYVRQKISLDTSMKMTELPKSQWVKPEEDVPYLRMHLRNYRQEQQERVAWRS